MTHQTTDFFDRNGDTICFQQDDNEIIDDMYIANALQKSKDVNLTYHLYLLRKVAESNLCLEGDRVTLYTTDENHYFHVNALIQLMIQADMILELCGDVL